jgi:hypothetical protein
MAPTRVGEEPGREGGGILGVLSEAAGSRGEMTVGDVGERHI